ncbi:MAG: HAD-IA family hydrolase [Nocardioidaceae bacterium]
MTGAAENRSVFDAVLFDLDQTVVDSSRAVNRSWSRWALEYGLAPDAVVREHGSRARDIVADLVEPALAEEALARIVELECADPAVSAFPEVARALRLLSPDRVAIVTSSTRRLAYRRLALAGLDAPRVLVAADDVTQGKPHPEPYLTAAAQLAVEGSRCLVVEDAPTGVEAGLSMGATTVGVTTSVARDELRADYVVDQVGELRFTVAEEGVNVSTQALGALARVPRRVHTLS